MKTSPGDTKHLWIQSGGAILSGAVAAVALWKNLSILAAVLGGVCLGLLAPALYYFFKLRGVYNVLGGAQSQETRDSVLVKMDLPQGSRSKHRACHIGGSTPGPGALSVNWVTFLKGCDTLTAWVKSRVKPSLYIGVNPAGTIIASHIRGSLGHDAPLATCFIPEGAPHDSAGRYLNGVPTSGSSLRGPVLIVDSQIKTGVTAGAIEKALRKRLDADVAIWYVALIACGIPRDGVRSARTLSETKDGPLPLASLFLPQVNTFVEVSVPLCPHCVVYLAESFVELPGVAR